MSDRLKRAALVVLVAAFPLVSGAAAGSLTPHDSAAAKAAFTAIKGGDWKRARRDALPIKDPVAAKLFDWLDLTRQGATASFARIARFLAENPQWPMRSLLLRRAEEAISDNMPSRKVLDWFDDRLPASAIGQVRHGAALVASGQIVAGRAALRAAWVDGNFTKRQERRFYRRYRKYLTRQDHIERLDRLIWRGRYWPARRMLWKVNADWRALAEARLMLMRMNGNVDRAIERVPAALKDHPGLVYERLRWRRRKGLDSAVELIDGAPSEPAHAEKWWRERSILARRALRKGHISEAYRLVKGHGLEQGPAFAEAEWLAGWIMLRFLKEHATALRHFKAMYTSVAFPISRARGAYWAARAAEKAEKVKLAKTWYRSAARFSTTYYGQLAAARLAPGSTITLAPEPLPSTEEADAFADQELVRAVEILDALGERERLRPFILRLSELREAAGWQKLTADLARTHHRPDLAIAVAKKASRAGRELIMVGYPTVTLPPVRRGKPRLEVPLVLAVVRQESAFQPKAQSGAGARGLMQLLPRTARDVAKELKIQYTRGRLTADPRFNLELGQAYLANLLSTFQGSYVLALAAYNAGPSRARRWMRMHGNPRHESVDVIDWIEMIPIEETRNYIQRVMEGVQVYRGRLNGMEVALNLERDLKR